MEQDISDGYLEIELLLRIGLFEWNCLKLMTSIEYFNWYYYWFEYFEYREIDIIFCEMSKFFEESDFILFLLFVVLLAQGL